jgi:hypothetical protein
MAVIGNISSADFQPHGDITDLARPPGADRIGEEQMAVPRPTGRIGGRRSRRGKRRGKRSGAR